MPAYGPISRRRLIAALRQGGFVGPMPGAHHEFMVRGNQRVYVPNPHRGDISVGLLDRILRQAGITRDEWEELK